MNLVDAYRLISNIKCEERKQLAERVKEAISSSSAISEHNIAAFCAAVCIKQGKFCENGTILAYGAGKMAGRFLPRFLQSRTILSVYDQYSPQESICGIPVVKPDAIRTEALKYPIVIFVNNAQMRREIATDLKKKGFANVYFFREYLDVLDRVEDYKVELKSETEENEILSIIDDVLDSYGVIDSNLAEVNYTTVKRQFKELEIRTEPEAPNLIKKDLSAILKLVDKKEQFDNACDSFLRMPCKTIYELAEVIELFLRNALQNSVKTVYRPIRMAGDQPYDLFAVFETVKVCLERFLSDDDCRLNATTNLRELAPHSITLIATECHFLNQMKRFEEALQLSREAVYLEPNSLLANEIFYHTALECKRNGITVSEPLPQYDLSERFCWSGINFAWCGGTEASGNHPLWGPCFRPLQCAALPNGDFWRGDEWQEFRKSILDGSFRYCQKNQCPNIVAGWLPRKDEYNAMWFRKMLNETNPEVPALEELHFSYDSHCNLCCPSCRTAFCTNSKMQEEQLDELYEKYLEPRLEGAKHLCLSGCGEALLSPHSKRVLQSLSKEKYPNLAVELRTNMTVLNEKNWLSLGKGTKCIRHIAASIDSCSKDNFEKLRYPAKWEIILQNLEYAKRLREEGEIDLLEFHVVVQDSNVHELVGIIEMAAKFGADVVTFSKIVNWMEMDPEEYKRRNPFFPEHPLHQKLEEVIEKILQIRDEIEAETWEFAKKKMYINMHFVPDPNESYDVIRSGPLKIR